eukprot:4689317-Lingulodinium_polyedra.AAC.1
MCIRDSPRAAQAPDQAQAPPRAAARSGDTTLICTRTLTLATAGAPTPPLPQMGRILSRGLRLGWVIRSAPVRLRTR